MHQRLVPYLLPAIVSFGCDVPSMEVAHQTAPVIGGELTPDGMYPATGALMEDGQFFCTGTLIAPDVVLTAAHCLYATASGGPQPSFTLANDTTTTTIGEQYAGASSHIPPNFTMDELPPPGLQHADDIGVLILQQPVPDVEPERLPSREAATAHLLPSAQLELVGYGLTSNDSWEAGIKHHGVAELVQRGDWELLIAKPGQQQNCNGDSGGPAFLQVDGEPLLVGIVSRAPDDDPVCDHGGIDTRVDAYLDWIHTVAPSVPCPDATCDSLDAGPTLEPDAGATVEPDAGTFEESDAAAFGADASTGDDDHDDAGCGCNSSQATSSLLGLLGLVALIPRRRRR